jgi:glycosyltransferase involved in cell wall biosynthesis
MFSLQKYGGITKYFCELIKNLPNECKFELSVLFSENQHLKDDYQFFKKLYIPIPKAESRIKGHLKINSYRINNLYSRKVISSNNYDLFHPTYYNPYFLRSLKKPYIITVHDLIEFKFQEQYKDNSLIPDMKKIIQNAARIISISENTKKDLIELLKIQPGKIDVIHHGFNKTVNKKNENRFGRYLLFVGSRRGYKNFSNLITSFASIIKNDQELKLICTGMPFTKEEINELKEKNLLEKVIVIGVNEKELNNLYSHALAFVYPSLYEGFGMPILEAFSNNCPVCLSNTSSLPEVAGNAGSYFDGIDHESITKAIEKTIYDPLASAKMIAAGNERLKNFSWQKCAQQTAISYQSALSN